ILSNVSYCFTIVFISTAVSLPLSFIFDECILFLFGLETETEIADDGQSIEKRKHEYLRFGKRKHEYLRFGKRKHEYLRFGRK
ncbi:unnamed protein product, partial [Dracunculus medinensis]|uniref:FMRFamide-related neuropeptides n=1 Tax=Dracunculus medinensis TaxID=318479 RepID=A0A0N4UF36_DRAME